MIDIFASCTRCLGGGRRSKECWVLFRFLECQFFDCQLYRRPGWDGETVCIAYRPLGYLNACNWNHRSPCNKHFLVIRKSNWQTYKLPINYCADDMKRNSKSNCPSHSHAVSITVFDENRNECRFIRMESIKLSFVTHINVGHRFVSNRQIGLDIPPAHTKDQY